jgi:hypothetical protein
VLASPAVAAARPAYPGVPALPAPDFEAVETAVRRHALLFAARAVEQRLNADHSDFTGARRACSCGQPARYGDRRAKPFQTVLDELRIALRCYKLNGRFQHFWDRRAHRVGG